MSFRSVKTALRLRPVRYIVWGQALFAAMMAVCLVKRPAADALAGGLSYYGVHVDTAVPFVAGVAGCAFLTAVATFWIESRAPWVPRLRAAILTVLVLMVGIPATPYSIDIVLDWLHIGISVVLFAGALAVGGWIALIVRTLAALVLVAVQAMSGLVAGAAQVGLVGLMIPSQIVFQFAFAALVVAAIATAHHGQPRKPDSKEVSA